jgi:FkbM family methyltransferase
MDVFIDAIFDPEYRAHPIVLADVGARGGVKASWAAAAKHLRVIGFEPDPKEYARLAASAADSGGRTVVFRTALHNRQATLPLYIAQDRGLTSIFPPNRSFLDQFPDAARFDTIEVQHLDVDTLDHQLESEGIDDIDFVKVDTQGSELFVLQGAAATLERSVAGVEVEVEFASIYQEQPLFADVDRHLRDLGFQLFDLRPVYWKRETGRSLGGPYGQIVWADALYLKQLPALSTMVGRLGPDLRKSKVLRAISVSLLYGYHDYALAIARSAADLLSPDEIALVESRITAAGQPGDGVPEFPGRRQLAAVFKRLWKACRPPADGWSVSDAEVGNRE